jgi:hypothetical protein
MPSDYRLQIIHVPTNKVVHEWAPGLRVETDLIMDLCARVATKPFGFLRTRKRIVTHVQKAIEELILDLKVQV